MPTHRLWPATPGPSVTADDGQPVNLAHEVEVTTPCSATHLHFHRPDTTITGPVTGRLYRSTGPGTGELVAGPVTFDLTGDPTGWITTALPEGVSLTPGEKYKACVRFPAAFPIQAGYWGTGGTGETGIVQGYLSAPNAAGAVDGQGSFSTGAATVYPGSGSVNQANYGIDITVTDEMGGTVAEHNAQPGDTAAHVTLTAATEMVVSFREDLDQVAVVNRGAGELFATADNSPAVVDGAKAHVIPAGARIILQPASTNGRTVVRLISTGTPKVSVERTDR